MTLAFVALSMVCPDSLNALGSTVPVGEDPPPPPPPLVPGPPQLAGEPLSDALVVEAEGISRGLKPRKKNNTSSYIFLIIKSN